MIIDNIEKFRKFMTFEDKHDRYIVHILRRPKDVKELGNELGSNECQRLLRTYYIDSLEYFDKKIPAIKELCKSNRARAYIIPQVRNNEECLLNLAEKVIETIRLKNYSVKPEHLLRSAYCEYHNSRKKVWILDLDNDSMTEKKEVLAFPGPRYETKTWTVNEVLSFVKSQLIAVGKKEDECFVIDTKSGHHIITSPFNLQAAYKDCSMLFEGVHKVDGKEIVGWLHKDGMSLLYLDLD